MIYKWFLLLLLPLTLFGATIDAPEVKSLIPIDVTEFRLKNGMKVVLKPTSYDEGEVFIRVSARKGYVNLPEPLRPSARTMHDFVWESGIGPLTADTLSVFLFENGIEFNFGIGSAERFVEGEGRADRALQLLQLVRDLFILTRVDRSTLASVKERVEFSLDRTECDSNCVYETVFRRVNTGNFAPLAPLLKKDVEGVNFETLDRVLIEAYQDPSEFVAVIVGDFEPQKMVEWVQKTLGTIPPTRRAAQWNETDIPKFPTGVVTENVKKVSTGEVLTRISFPITQPITQENVVTLDVMIEAIEARLRDVIQRRYGNFYGVDVSYEFPLYPSLEDPWLTVQFRSDSEMTQKLSTLVMNQIADLKRDGPSSEDIEAAKLQKKRSDEYWIQNNRFWVSALTHYYLSGWDPALIQYNYSGNGVDAQEVTHAIKNYFPLDNYTIVTGGV